MKDINLENLYEDNWLDLENTSEPLGRFIWMDLEYWRGGETITIKPFKIDALEMLSHLEYFNKNFHPHADRVRDFCKFMDEQIDMISKMDYNEDEYKHLAQEEWEEMDDEEKDEYDDDFDEYWEKYTSSESFQQMVADDQSMQWDQLREEFEDEFEVIDRTLGSRGDFFDSYGNALISVVDKFDEAVEEITEMVEEFKRSEYDANEMSNQQRIDFFGNIFI